MTISFKPAKRENVPLLIGLAGASGSGKTFTALALAMGIAEEMARAQGREPVIAAIDTERRRMLHYADIFPFLHAELEPPFRPQRFVQAVQAAEEMNPHVILLDSFSHEFEGEGGIRDWADELEASGKKAPANWSEPKLEHKKLVNHLLRSKAHIIVCLRAEEKMKVEAVPQVNADGSPRMWNGKQATKMVITPSTELSLRDRWVPITEKRFPYEITTSFLLTPDNPGVPIPLKLQEQHRAMFPEGQQVTRETGRQLARWAIGAAQPAAELTDKEARDALATAQTLDALAIAWRNKAMAPHRERLAGLLEQRKAELSPPPAQEHEDERHAKHADQGHGYDRGPERTGGGNYDYDDGGPGAGDYDGA